MGCCQAKANRENILSQPPTANQGAAEWSDYGNADLRAILPEFGSVKGNEADDRKRFWTWDRNAVLPIRYAAQGPASGGIVDAIIQSIKSCHSDLMGPLLSNILLVGGNAKIPGFRERVVLEIAAWR